MKVALLSDIHGNIVAFDAVLKDAKENGVDTYIVLGDLITDFPFSNEVIEKVRDLTPYVIKGNREKYLEEYEKTQDEDRWNTKQNSIFRYYYNDLKKENREYIMHLPEDLDFNLDDFKIKVVHATPYYISKLVYFSKKELINKIAKNLKEDILVYGHNHEEAGILKVGKKTLVQAGAIGMHDKYIVPEYMIIEYEDGKLNFIKRQVDYNKKELKEKIEQTELLKKYPTWVNLCYSTIEKGIDIRTDFIDDAIKLMKTKYAGKKQNGIDSNFNVIDDDIYTKLSKEYEKYFLLKRR